MTPTTRAADVVLLGGGGAGTAVLHHLALHLLRQRQRRPLRVVVVDPLDRLAARPADRTWCSWVPRGGRAEAELGPAVHRWWPTVLVVARDGSPVRLDLAPLRYAMVRGEDYYAHVAALVARAVDRGALDLAHLPVAALDVEEDATAARVVLPQGHLVAPVVLDSRPAPPARPGASSLVQHFLGQRVRGAEGSVDPDRAVLMDFSVPQPPVGLAFGYCLPSDTATSLVEHTAFVPEPLAAQEQAAALAAYLPGALGTTTSAGLHVEHVEAGAIPMTDAPFTQRPAAPPGQRRSRVVRLGTAGGAVRPSTGYAFTAMHRAARALAGQLAAGVPGDRLDVPRPYPRRHAWMDALVLRALIDGPQRGGLEGPDFFVRLFTRNPPQRVLRFLDGLTGPAEELALMATSPRGPMLRAAARDAAWRLGGGR
ncbi:lycopene cyclase [Streptomyces sp. NP160]|uniref:lycopene cyclase family protein n=1 Tax=Streptomyces sp. NP160 TaxID=2586637 RepID=UPI001117B1D7|nr:lycopene cyclase family protein [Streptomyces sp. NP160]TNM69068.1 lycopene cyclase [Streptomyces sp. NP160]